MTSLDAFPLDDRGLLLGDGLFETLLWTGEVLKARDVPPLALRAGLKMIRAQLRDYPAATTVLESGLASVALASPAG